MLRKLGKNRNLTPCSFLDLHLRPGIRSIILNLNFTHRNITFTSINNIVLTFSISSLSIFEKNLYLPLRALLRKILLN